METEVDDSCQDTTPLPTNRSEEETEEQSNPDIEEVQEKWKINGHSCAFKTARHEKQVTRLLRDIDDDFQENDHLSGKVYVGGSMETFNAWEKTLPHVKYIVPKRKKNAGNDESLTNDQDVESDPYVHSYEVGFVDCPSWNLAIEPLTYHYIKNNGRYRASKLGKRNINPNNKTRSNGKHCYNREKLRQAIQETLSKEFAVYIQCEQQKDAVKKQKELLDKTKKKPRPVITNEHKDKSPVSSPRSSKNSRESQRNVTNKELNSKPHLKDSKHLIVSNDDFTPRSNLSVLSAHAPLPPISVPLASSEDDSQSASNIPDGQSFSDSNVKLKLWHVPTSVSVPNEAEDLVRHRSAPKLLEYSSLSEPTSRAPSRGGQNKSSLYKLKKLPTINDFPDVAEPEMTRSSVIDAFVVRRMSQPSSMVNFRELGHYKDNDLDSIQSEPAIAQSPVLQGTAYDISKLQTRTGKPFNHNPNASTNVIHDVKIVNNNDGLSTKESLQYLATKYKHPNVVNNISDDTLDGIISTKQYVTSKTRTKLNPYLDKSGNNVDPAFSMGGLEGGMAQPFKSVQLTTKRNNSLNRDMPGMFVRRAEISTTTKRVI